MKSGQNDLLNLSPFHLLTLSKNLDTILELKEHINLTEKIFNRYSECGFQLSQWLQKLSETFQCYEEFKTDPTLRNITELLYSFSCKLNDHYLHVKNHIIVPLKNFVKIDISKAEEDGRKAKNSLEYYNKVLEQFASLNRKKQINDLDGKEAKLMAASWQAVYSNFIFDRSIKYVQRKKLLEITGTFLMFINLTRLVFKECLFDFDSTNDLFSNLLQALPVSSKEIQNYNDKTITLGKSLECCFTDYWERLRSKFQSTTKTEHEGYLWKKGKRFANPWQRRYFICKNHALSYYNNNNCDKPKFVLPLLLTSVKEVDEPERRFCFSIISREKVYVLQALTEWDMKEWISIIQNNIKDLLDCSDNIDLDTHLKDETTISPLPSNPCNCICADCGVSNPKWCCINWGICICINCSGVHRSLTTNVSKVRSLTLDHIDNYTRQLFEIIGNENANSILEYNVNNQKISENCTKEEREDFIRRKYAELEFIPYDVQENDIYDAIKNADILKTYISLCKIKKEEHNSQSSYTPLHIAASYGNPLICLLICLNSNKIDCLDQGDWSPLSYATFYGHIEAVEVLLSFGCNPNSTKKAHPFLIARSLKNKILETMLSPYWENDNKQEEIIEFIPPNPI